MAVWRGLPLRGSEIQEKDGRKPYPLGESQVTVRHFVVRTTRPGTPFRPHTHERPELWYIIAGRALVNLDGTEHPIQGGDLIAIEPWVEHGLRTESQVTWICLG
jgi:mannose-6-phosphate isomerase-like protein (cupin superfamily)